MSTLFARHILIKYVCETIDDDDDDDELIFHRAGIYV